MRGRAMTEAEWLACGDPEKMLAWIYAGVSNRKARLFAVACCRLEAWTRLVDERLAPYPRGGDYRIAASNRGDIGTVRYVSTLSWSFFSRINTVLLAKSKSPTNERRISLRRTPVWAANTIAGYT